MTQAFAAACLFAIQSCALAPSPESAGGGDDVAVLADRLAGEYTNHAQVWAARQGGESPPGEYQVTIVPLESAGASGRLLHFRQYRSGERASPHREARLLLEPGPDGGVTQRVQRRVADGWQSLAGCTVHWQRTGERFEGRTRGDQCRFRHPASGDIVTRHRHWTAGPDGFTWEERRVTQQGETSESLRFVPVRWYTGWAGVRERDDDGGGQGEWRVERDLRLHDGGAVRELPAVDGAAHALRLERLHWPNSGIRMLRLSVIEADSGEAVAYAWAPPDADSIGIHLGWLQAGLQAADASADISRQPPPATP